MGTLLNVSEVVEFAVTIEQNGYKFYIESIKRFPDAKLTELFQFLADEESKHEGVFKSLLKSVGSFTPPESYQGEYAMYATEFLKSHALADSEVLAKKIASINNREDAARVALDFEKDSIAFFSMLKNYVEDEHKSIVEAIIQEELKHILKITRFLSGA